MSRRLIEPEPVHVDQPGYTADAWDYPRRCADVELALTSIREQVEEWDRNEDPHGWWHQRPMLIAVHNEVLRLRQTQS